MFNNFKVFSFININDIVINQIFDITWNLNGTGLK